MRTGPDSCACHHASKRQSGGREPAPPEKKRQRESCCGRGVAGRERIVGVVEDEPLRVVSHSIPALRDISGRTRPPSDPAEKISRQTGKGRRHHHHAQHPHPITPPPQPCEEERDDGAEHQPMPGKETAARLGDYLQRRKSIGGDPAINRIVNQEGRNEAEQQGGRHDPRVAGFSFSAGRGHQDCASARGNQ